MKIVVDKAKRFGIVCSMQTEKNSLGGDRTHWINESLGHRIEPVGAGFHAVYNEFGYIGTFGGFATALQAHRNSVLEPTNECECPECYMETAKAIRAQAQFTSISSKTEGGIVVGGKCYSGQEVA